MFLSSGRGLVADLGHVDLRSDGIGVEKKKRDQLVGDEKQMIRRQPVPSYCVVPAACTPALLEPLLCRDSIILRR